MNQSLEHLCAHNAPNTAVSDFLKKAILVTFIALWFKLSDLNPAIFPCNYCPFLLSACGVNV